jgi:hypothetical protein
MQAVIGSIDAPRNSRIMSSDARGMVQMVTIELADHKGVRVSLFVPELPMQQTQVINQSKGHHAKTLFTTRT